MQLMGMRWIRYTQYGVMMTLGSSAPLSFIDQALGLFMMGASGRICNTSKKQQSVNSLWKFGSCQTYVGREKLLSNISRKSMNHQPLSMSRPLAHSHFSVTHAFSTSAKAS